MAAPDSIHTLEEWVVLTPPFRGGGAPDGRDETREHDYAADEGDPTLRRMTEILDGEPVARPASLFEPVPRRSPEAPYPRR